MNVILKQLLQWPPTNSTVMGVGLLLFVGDFLYTGNVAWATMIAGIFVTICPEAKAAVDKLEQEIKETENVLPFPKP